MKFGSRVGERIDLPIYVPVVTQQKARLSQQFRNIESFYGQPVTLECTFGTEEYLGDGIK